MPQLSFGPYIPDRPDYEHPGTLTALNVIPKAVVDQNGGTVYGPLPSVNILTPNSALTARCQGAASFRSPADGAIYTFAGDATSLYKVSISGVTLSNISLAGGYATPADENWCFTQFGTRIIATNGADDPQSYVMGTSTLFEDLSATAPVASHCATIRDFAVFGRVSGFNTRIQWGPIGAPAGTWGTDAETQADFQDLPEHGYVTAVMGGEYGIAMQERAMHRMTYEGPPTVFRFDLLAHVGCVAPRSMVQMDELGFWLSENGFFAISHGQEIRPIGHNVVDRFFIEDVNLSFYHRIVGAADLLNRLYVVAYPSNDSSDGTPDKMLLYSPRLDRWTAAEADLEYLFSLVPATSLTLEDLDAISASIDDLPFSLDSRAWVGEGRPLLGAFSTAHKMAAFSGSNLAATIDTMERQIVPGRRAMLRNVRPITDASCSVTPGTRNLQTESVTWGSAVSVNAIGNCPLRSEGRYHRARMTIAASAVWNHAQGLDEIEVVSGGIR